MVEYEFHEVARKEPLTYQEIDKFGCQNWCLYAADPPAGPDHAWAYHFRRASAGGPDRRPAPKLKGGLAGDRGPRLSDLAGRYTPLRTSIRLRRS